MPDPIVDDIIVCQLKALPNHMQVDAANDAVKENPTNRAHTLNGSPNGVLTPLKIALLTSRYWGSGGVRLGVSFMDTNSAELKSKILLRMNAWAKWSNVQFLESRQGHVRIARTPGEGYYSYLGTDVLSIPVGQPTMNLDSFSLSTPDSEYLRVVRHETGHTLGFPHEHMRQAIVNRIDPAKAIAYFARMDGWDAQTVREQVLTPLNEADLQDTPADVMSIMCYQLPGSIMKDGVAVPGGVDIDPTDAKFAGLIYPLAVVPPPPPPPPPPGIAWNYTLTVDPVTGEAGLKRN